MKRAQLLREIQDYCLTQDPVLKYDWKKGKGNGKGSHGTVYVGNRKTTVKNGEIDPIIKQNVLKKLGISKTAF